MKKIQVLHQAPDESGAAESEKVARKNVSKRAYIDSQGNEVDKIELATGGRYTLLHPAGNVNFDEQFGPAGTYPTMSAIFGHHTKCGNVANTVYNDKSDDGPGTPDDAVGEITKFLTAAKAGTWAERTGGVGSRIDKEALAQSIIEVAKAAGKTAAYDKIRQKLEEDPQYVRAARQVPAVATAYATRVGRTTKSVEDLLV